MHINRIGFFILLVISVTVVLSGCGIVYSTPSHNLQDIQKAEFARIKKTGQSCQYWILEIPWPFQRYSIKEAADSAWINKVEFVEYDVVDFLLFKKACVVVYGQ